MHLIVYGGREIIAETKDSRDICQHNHYCCKLEEETEGVNKCSGVEPLARIAVVRHRETKT